MPYDRNSQLPKGARHALPGHAQSIFRNVVNSALASGASDESAHRQAWGVVGHGYKRPKGGGMWSRRTGKAGAGALNYPNWTTQSQKSGDDEALLDLPSNHLRKYNENHDNRGRFSSGGGGGGSSAEPSRKPKFRSGVSAAEEAKYNQGSQPGFRFKDHVRNFEREQGVTHSSDPNKIRAAIIEDHDTSSDSYGFHDMLARHYGVGRDYRHVEEQEPDTPSPKPSLRQRLFGKLNPNHDERGRFSSGPGGGGTTTSMAMAARAKGGKSSLKSLRSAFQSTVKQRRKLDSNIATLKNRMTQYKRPSPAHTKASIRLQSLRLQRTELTRELNRLSSAIVRSAGGKSYHQDWVSSILAGFPVVQPTSRRPSRKSDDTDLFEIRRPFT